jgi:hypothetical protein
MRDGGATDALACELMTVPLLGVGHIELKLGMLFRTKANISHYQTTASFFHRETEEHSDRHYRT